MIRLKAGFVGGFGVKHFVGDTRAALASATRAGVEAATTGLKDQIRDQIEGVGLGRRLGQAVGSKVFPGPKKSTLHPAGVVFPRGKLAEDIFDSFSTGGTIRSKSGGWLAIPTRHAYLGGKGGKRPTPGEFERRTGIKLRLAQPRKSKRGRYQFLVGTAIESSTRSAWREVTRRREQMGRKTKTVVFFILIKQVSLGKRLDFPSLANRWADRIPGLIERATPEALR